MKNNLLKGILGLVLCLLIIGCSSNRVKNNEELNTNKEERTIWDNKKIKCRALDQYEIIGSMPYYNSVMLLSDGYLYSYIMGSDQYYSNDEQCMKYNNEIKFKSIKNNILIGEDGKGYYLRDDKFDELTDEDDNKIFLNDDYVDYLRIYFNDEDESIYSGGYDSGDYYNLNYYYLKYLILKTDGNIYETVFKKTQIYYYESEYSIYNYDIVSEKVLYSKDDYGEIKYFSGMDKLNYLVSSKGLYTLETIETDECKKYVDIECKKKLTLNDVYLENKDKIKYIDKNIAVSKDNEITNTNDFQYFNPNYIGG